jgi:hypothetical protein
MSTTITIRQEGDKTIIETSPSVAGGSVAGASINGSAVNGWVNGISNGATNGLNGVTNGINGLGLDSANGTTSYTAPVNINDDPDRVKFAYWVPNVSGGLVISKIHQKTK